MAQIKIVDALGVEQDAALVTNTGQAVSAASLPVVIASDQAAVSITEMALTIDGAAAQAAIVNNILGTVAGPTGTDVRNYRCASVQVVSTGTGGTFIFEQSNDGVNWRSLPVHNPEILTGAVITAAIAASVSQIIYSFPIRARFIRLRIATAITGGSIQAFSRFSAEPWMPSVTTIAQQTAANLVANANLMAGTNTIGGVFIQPTAATVGGLATVNNLASAAASVNNTLIKGGAGRVYKVRGYNAATSPRYLKFFNKSTAPVAGTDTALFQIPLAPSSAFDFDVGNLGVAFPTGIGFAITAAAALNDGTAIAAADIVGMSVFYA